jgi:protein SCO1/2
MTDRSVKRPFLPRWLGIAVVTAGLLAGCGGSSKPATQKPTAASGVASLNGALANPPFKSEPLALQNFDGKPVNLAAYRGKTVLVTFIYTHCPDVCPLIVSNLHTAQAQLGPRASKLQIVAVSVDPKGDTPKTVTAFLRARQMLGRMDYLIGSRSRLQAVWKRWGIVSKAAPSSPAQVEHSALIYGIGASGRVYTLYPANFKPQWIVHDVPILASH